VHFIITFNLHFLILDRSFTLFVVHYTTCNHTGYNLRPRFYHGTGWLAPYSFFTAHLFEKLEIVQISQAILGWCGFLHHRQHGAVDIHTFQRLRRLMHPPKPHINPALTSLLPYCSVCTWWRLHRRNVVLIDSECIFCNISLYGVLSSD